MASRKEQKEQARAQRLAKEQELAAKQQRQRRIQILGGVVVLAIVIVGVVIAISVGGGSSNSATGTTSTGGGAGSLSDYTGLQTGPAAAKTSKYVDNLLTGIPQSGTVLGKPSAKVTMQYFGDLQCPVCREFTMAVLPEFISKQVRTGNAKLDYKSFCTATCNDFSQSEFDNQQVAAYAAGKQSKFWNYTELFYHEQGTEGAPYMNETFLNDLAKQSGLNISTWATDRKDPTLLSQLQADNSLALKDSVGATPTVIAQGPKGEEVVGGSGVPSYSEMVAAIKTVS